VHHVIQIENAESWLTPEQRHLLTNRRRWEQAAKLKASLSAASVRDPEVRDLWPK